MESRRTRAKVNQHHQNSDGPMTSTVKKPDTTFVASRVPFHPSESTSPIPHASRSFDQKSDPKSRKATKYIRLICEAIEAVGNGKKGASVQAIKKWILGNNPEIQERFIKTGIKNAFAQGLEEGTLTRPAKSKLVTGAVGSFCVAKEADKNKNTGKAVKAAKQPVQYASDTELTINRGRTMSVRLNLSDTELAEVRKSLAFEAKPKMRGGKSVKKVAAESAEESSSEEEEQIEPVVKAQTKKISKASKAPKKTAPTKPPRKAASSKTKDEKETAPSKPKRGTRNKKNAKENDTATKKTTPK